MWEELVMKFLEEPVGNRGQNVLGNVVKSCMEIWENR